MIAVAEEVEWSKEDEKLRIANDKYGGIEATTVNWLFVRLPSFWTTYEDLVAEVRLWSLQAVEVYNPQFRTKFSSFLTNHLRMVSKRAIHSGWLDRRRPAGGSVVSIADMQTSPYSMRDEPSIDHVHYYDYSISAGLQIEEMRNSLSKESRDIFDMLVKTEDQEDLCDSFRSLHWRSRLQNLTGLSRDQLNQFRDEMSHAIRQYV